MSKLKLKFENLPQETQSLLQDLSPSLKEVTVDKNDWVYQYRDKKELAGEMYSAFIKYNKKKAKKEANKFIFSDDLPEDGILSLTQAFQTIATMISDLSLDDKKSQAQIPVLVDEILRKTIDENGNYVFDASPYLTDSSFFCDPEHAYIDTMTWVMSSLLSAIRLHQSGLVALSDDQLEKIYRVFNHCMEYLTDSFIENDPSKTTSNLLFGWNFTKGCTQPSLYFTFAVTEVFLDFFSTFENVIKRADEVLLCNLIDESFSGFEMNEELKIEILQKKAQVKEASKVLLSDVEYQKEENFFFRLNNGNSVYAGNSYYSKLETQCKKVADHIWSTVKNFEGGLNENFFTADLTSVVDESSFEKSISNDAVFNSLFIINILMNSGLDEDLEDKVNYFTANGSDAYGTALDEYDEIRDAIRFAYDNAYLAYTRLVKKGKEYKINEYSLSFDEKFPAKLTEAVKELRKAHIRVFSLMPLLVKAKTTMSEFVIKYPQYDMQIYLENILEYRLIDEEDDESRLWIWEKDGYSSSSNYYFSSALADFYKYYEKYEETSTKNQSATRNAYLTELRRPDGEIGILQAKLKSITEEKNVAIAKLEEKNSKLENDFEELLARYNNDPLRQVFTEFVKQAIADYLTPDNIGSLLSVLSNDLTSSAKNRVAKKAATAGDATEKFAYNTFAEYDEADYSTLEQGVQNFGKAIFAESAFEKTYNKKNVSNIDAEFTKISKAITSDIRKSFRFYIEPRAKGFDSDYVRTKGYNGLVDILNKENESNKKSDN